MSDPHHSRRRRLLADLFRDYGGPPFSIRLWNGWQWASSPAEKPVFTVVIEAPNALTSLMTEQNEIALGEAFIRRDIDVEGDIFSVFFVAEYLINRPKGLLQRTAELIARSVMNSKRWLSSGFQHSKARDRASISYHYDQPVEFFRPWLGSTLAYSCAYFRSPQDSLDLAQWQKLELICQKLRLQPLERFLDVGCGWGSLVLRAAGKYHAHAHGITLSRIQAQVTQERIKNAELCQRSSVELRDYRDCNHLAESFDKIASVGMFEHVGLKNLPEYFRTIRGLLRPGGTFLNHGIARSPLSPVHKNSFIDRYVFPDGHLVTLSEAMRAAEDAGLEVRDVENLREHYELTLRRWVEGLRQNEEALRNQVSDTTYRIWLLYMAGSAAAFRRGDIAVYQVLLSRPNRGQSELPLTREDWYVESTQDQGIAV